MKLKIIFGIIIPLLIIVLLAFFGTLNVGFNVSTNYISELSINKIIVDGKIPTVIEVGYVNVSNEYFLPKRYNLPRLVPCLIDNENVNQVVNAGTITYGEGDYQYNQDAFYPYNGNDNSQNVQIGTNTEKRVSILLQPEYYFTTSTYDDLLKNYKAYDSVIFYKLNNRAPRYTNCYSLPNSDYASEEAKLNLTW